jgi:hypothetical protein
MGDLVVVEDGSVVEVVNGVDVVEVVANFIKKSN